LRLLQSLQLHPLPHLHAVRATQHLHHPAVSSGHEHHLRARLLRLLPARHGLHLGSWLRRPHPLLLLLLLLWRMEGSHHLAPRHAYQLGTRGQARRCLHLLRLHLWHQLQRGHPEPSGVARAQL
jgi:hypothetical protein